MGEVQTPWGVADRVKVVDEKTFGFLIVDTPSHGGFLIRRDFAEQHLSASAIRRGVRFPMRRGAKTEEWLAYEEDQAWAIPAFELETFWPKIFDETSHVLQDPKAHLTLLLSGSYADYLLERGVKPDPDMYARFKQHAAEEQLRAAGSPELIVAAFGDWKTKRPGVVKVATADGKEHFVTAASYDKASAEGRTPLLSACTRVPAVPEQEVGLSR